MSKDTRAPLINEPVSVTIVLFATFTRPLVAKASVGKADKVPSPMVMLQMASFTRRALPDSRSTSLFFIATPYLSLIASVSSSPRPAHKFDRVHACCSGQSPGFRRHLALLGVK